MFILGIRLAALGCAAASPDSIKTAMPPAGNSAIARVCAAIGALVAWLALALQLALLIRTQAEAGQSAGHALLLYFGFFTILTNVLCALILSASLAAPSPGGTLGTLQTPWLRTSAAAAITIVGCVYFLVLRHLWHPAGLQFWVDCALHYAVPLLFLAFWWIAIPAGTVQWADIPRILLYPAAYLIYVFARGALTGLYPYFFIDVPNIGVLATARNTLAVLAALLVVVSLLILVNRRRTPR